MPVPDPAALASFTAWCADGLADYPDIAEAGSGRVYIRAAEARELLWRVYLAGWRRSRDGRQEVADTC